MTLCSGHHRSNSLYHHERGIFVSYLHSIRMKPQPSHRASLVPHRPAYSPSATVPCNYGHRSVSRLVQPALNRPSLYPHTMHIQPLYLGQQLKRHESFCGGYLRLVLNRNRDHIHPTDRDTRPVYSSLVCYCSGIRIMFADPYLYHSASFSRSVTSSAASSIRSTLSQLMSVILILSDIHYQ